MRIGPMRIAVELGPREPPLVPSLVVARGAVARALVRRLLAHPGGDAALAKLRGVAAKEVVAILGEAEQLPWVDGVSYLGRDPAAPSLLMPVTMKASVEAGLLERAVGAAFPSLAQPVALLVDPPAVIPLGGARSVTREALEAWLAANGEAGGGR